MQHHANAKQESNTGCLKKDTAKEKNDKKGLTLNVNRGQLCPGQARQKLQIRRSGCKEGRGEKVKRGSGKTKEKRRIQDRKAAYVKVGPQKQLGAEAKQNVRRHKCQHQTRQAVCPDHRTSMQKFNRGGTTEELAPATSNNAILRPVSHRGGKSKVRKKNNGNGARIIAPKTAMIKPRPPPIQRRRSSHVRKKRHCYDAACAAQYTRVLLSMCWSTSASRRSAATPADSFMFSRSSWLT